MSQTEMIILLCALPLLFAQGFLLFMDAKKRGRYKWFWGIVGLINFPSSSILYWLCVVYPDRKKEEKIRKN
ncbi:transcriptional regulator [Bacillus pumilus]|uniref:transcriptional regulator n=1 Tax=Bacillus TaxID=1386 RepID=UPI00227FFEED|nr:transcriptional regulator [Bacillus pumilus]MCY7678803.1 transcriptional regulator [Bacillus pumilus]